MHWLLCIINHQNVVIKTTHKVLGRVSTAKISKCCNKNNAQGFGGVSTEKYQN